MTKVEKVRVWWDEADSASAGWYAVTYVRDSGENILIEDDDSLKIWFPVDLDRYDREDVDEVKSALTAAFPGAVIEQN